MAVDRGAIKRGWIAPLASTFAAALVLTLVVGGRPASAHHSISAVYDTTRQVTVEGRVTEFLFVNPHPVLVIDVAADGAAPQPWRLELDNRSELVEIGIDARTFKTGDRVVATGSAGRQNAQTLYAMKVARPADGLLYEQIGYAPRIKIPRAR